TVVFKDRVVATALANARAVGFDTVSCSSTGNLANATAAQAARNGFKCWIFIPADLEQAKIIGTQVFGAKLVRVSGSYDQVNRLCSQIADDHNWGFVNVNLRPYYSEGSKTFGDRKSTRLNSSHRTISYAVFCLKKKKKKKNEQESHK